MASRLSRGNVKAGPDPNSGLGTGRVVPATTALRQARDDLRVVREQQQATAQILKVISSSPSDVQPVFDAIARSALTLCGSAFANVYRYDGKLMHYAASAEVAPEQVELVKGGYPAPPDKGRVAGRAIMSRSVVCIEDALTDPDYDTSVAASTGWRRIFAAPMLREGEPLGAIAVGWTEPGPIPKIQEELLKTFADQAVIAIENVRLLNETREALERQTATSDVLKVISRSAFELQPVLDTVIACAVRLCGAEHGHVHRFDGELLRLAAGYSAVPEMLKYFRQHPSPLGPGSISGIAGLDRRPVHWHDVLAQSGYQRGEAQKMGGYRTILAVPMLRDDSLLGVIVIWKTKVAPFTEKQIEIVTTFADQAVIAIENVRLFNETNEALERQTATSEILRVISSSPTDIQPVLDAVAENAARVCGATDAHIFRLDGEFLRLVSSYGRLPTLDGFEEGIRINRGWVSGRAVVDRHTVHVHDLSTESDTELQEGKEYAQRFGHRTTLATPLLREGTPIGAILIRRKEVHAFSDKQITLLETFANQAVIAIENVRLFKELQARTEALTRSVGQLTALSEVGQVISSTLDLETVLKTIVSRALHLTGLDAGEIFEYDERIEEFHLRTAENLDEKIVEALRRSPMRKGEGAVGRSGVTGKPTEIPEILDTSYQSRMRELLVGSGLRAMLAVPLLREGHLLGALVVNRKAPGPFAPETVELLKTFATQSALAIQNARLFREIEEKGHQLEVASRHKSNFLASVSHELRTPLNAILGFNEMILGQVYGEVPADMQAPLAQIQTSGKHLLRLINNVLDLAKIEAGRMELSLQDYSVPDTVESVHSTLQPLAADKGLEFTATLPHDLPLAYGDAGRITQCLMNLVGNSLKFTKAGKVEISVALNDGTLVYRVADTGIGIPPDKLESVFAEFKQTDATIASEYGGTGLGLSISRKFVEMHGGRIWVESEFGKGSIFVFEIPLRVSAGATA